MRRRTLAQPDACAACSGGGDADPAQGRRGDGLSRRLGVDCSAPAPWARAGGAGMCRRLGLERVLHRQSSRERCLALALIVSRVIRPASKLATARALSPETADSSLGRLLGLEEIKGNELLAVLDWLRLGSAGLNAAWPADIRVPIP